MYLVSLLNVISHISLPTNYLNAQPTLILRFIYVSPSLLENEMRSLYDTAKRPVFLLRYSANLLRAGRPVAHMRYLLLVKIRLLEIGRCSFHL